MEKPNLNQMWEAFIKIGLPEEFTAEKVIHMIRVELHPLIILLKNEKIIKWYSFLIHAKESGVPTTADDRNLYFHLRFGLKEEVNPELLNKRLPDACLDMKGEKIRQIRPSEIAGVNKSLLKNEEIEEAWRIIGGQSEWVIDMLSIYKEEIEVPVDQVRQFMHFYPNMTGLPYIL